MTRSLESAHMKIVNRGETMKTELNERQIRVQVERATARKSIDPEELWLDQDIAPEELIELDPLDITCEMVMLAERPELADPILRELRPPRRFSIRKEALRLRRMRAELQEMHRETHGASQEERVAPFQEEGSV